MNKRMPMLIFFIMLYSTVVWAGFTGPSTIIQGNWGSGDADFGFESGDTMDSFPGLLLVDDADKIIIGDGVNLRIKIYDSAGNMGKNFTYKSITPIGGWPMNLKAKANVGIFTIYEKLQKYDYGGNLVWASNVPGFMDFWIADDGGIWLQKYANRNQYERYSPTGQLIKTYTERPLELGKVTEKPVDSSKVKITVTYPDKTYPLVLAGPYEKYQRDSSGKINAITGKLVKKFNECGKELGTLVLPVDQSRVVSPGGRGSDKVTALIEEYGQPVIAPNGDVYTWKRTPDNLLYSQMDLGGRSKCSFQCARCPKHSHSPRFIHRLGSNLETVFSGPRLRNRLRNFTINNSRQRVQFCRYGKQRRL